MNVFTFFNNPKRAENQDKMSSSKIKKYMEEVRERGETEVDLIDKAIMSFSEVPGIRK